MSASSTAGTPDRGDGRRGSAGAADNDASISADDEPSTLRESRDRDTSPERIRRNVACVNCRNSKVRCKPKFIQGRPCQRCHRLGTACVVDKSHKRVTKRNKLELLEQELNKIKETVKTNPPAADARPWISPQPGPDPAPGHAPGLARAPPPPPGPLPHPPVYDSVPRSGPSQPGAPGPENPGVPHSFGTPPEGFRPKSHTEARVLGERLVPAEDVDWHFDNFLQHFHPLLPILRKKRPNDCYRASPVLFWTVIYVSCRRYTHRDASLSAHIADHVSRDIWASANQRTVNLGTIHALLLLCSWPLDRHRFMSDTSSVYMAVALNACLAAGYHTGYGAHGQFAVGSRRELTIASDEEAASTWLACCILAQKASSHTGQPPPSIQFVDQRCKSLLYSAVWVDLITMYDLQKFLNRFNTAMNAQISVNGTVPDNIVSRWEDEFELLKPQITRQETDMSHLMILTAQLEIQSYYLTSPLIAAVPHACAACARLLVTARGILSAARDLEARSRLLTHACYWVFRAVLDAACVLVTAMHSASAPDVPAGEADGLAQRAADAIAVCSVREGDLAHRASVILETYWSVRDLLPRGTGAPPVWSYRLAAGLTFASLNRFKEGLLEAKKSTDVVNRGIKYIGSTRDETTRADQEQPPPSQGQDLLQDIDWSLFMDDFWWPDGNPVFLGIAP